MSIKDLFGKTSNKVVGKAELDKLDDEVESYDLITANTDKNNKLIPRIDYSAPENFARYGSAEKYYEDAINHILKSYPYDGSETEKMEWRNEASGLDEYILDYHFPSAVGHVKLNSSVTAATTYSDTGSGVWYRYAANTGQHITIKGGPHKDPDVQEDDEYELSKQFPPKGGRANIWDDEMFRESNLGINPSYGNTIEFWAKRDALLATNQSVCLFDLWNGAAHTAANYTRFTISVPGAPSSAGTHFHVTYKYGNAAEGVEEAGLTIPTATLDTMGATSGATWMQNWHHYAFAVSNTDSGIKIDLFIDGTYSTTVTAGNKITSTISQEGFVANINALRTKPLNSSPAALTDGDGGAKGLYLDEFRYWKKTRNAKEIGRYWFTPCFGGTNTDNTKYDKDAGINVDLGVYFKFNEGVYDDTTPTTTDAQCLDYSGRISNGTISNYSTAVRVTTSAMDESTKVIEMGVTEPKDPTMYATHTEIETLKTNLMLSGSMWDNQNNASFYHTMPGWILEEDNDSMVIKTLVQTLASYLDTIHSQIDMLGEIRDSKYFDLGDSQTKPVFFAKQLLRSVGFDVVDIFSEASSLEEIVSRGEQDMFENRIQDIKNVIYQNIYNNISYIYKTKGTEKSFRNLIRCFGVDDELVKLNLYADGVDYTLDGRRTNSSVKKNYIDFNHVDRKDGVAFSKDVYASSSDERGYVAGVTTDQAKLLSTTMTAQVIFPLQLDTDHPSFYHKGFNTISLFGCKEANHVCATATITTTGNPSNDETFVLTDAAGLAVTFVFKTGVATADGTKDGDNVIIGTSGAAGSAAAVGERIIAAINASDVAMTATEVSGGVVRLTQDGFGTAGHTAVDMSGVTTVTATNFTGAYELYDQTGTNQIGRMQIQAIMGANEYSSSTRDVTSARFKLIYTDADGDHEIISDEYKDVWDNSTWNFAVRIVPTDAALGDYVTGATASKYSIDFYGVQLQLGEVLNEFKLNAFYNGATAVAKARAMIATPKIFYIGHYRDNFAVNAGTLYSDVKVTDLMYWFDKLESQEIKIHSTDVTNTGRLYPNDDAYAFFSELSDGTVSDIRVPRKDTLALHWDFSNNTQSDASGLFTIDDVSGGGASYITEARYGWFTNLIGYRHTGVASFDAASCANDTNVINREYTYSAIHRLPEVLSGDDMVEIRTQDDDTFGKNAKPINHFWAIEKSMYQVISQEMLTLFASVLEFNDLIGQPVHRYRMEYKTLQKFRSLFYERVENVPSFEKFVAFYKWLDSSVGLMMQQLIPASGNFSESMRNMVENHLLERSKYWTKFPTLEMKQDPPAATLRGIREMTYDWEHGHAPITSMTKATGTITTTGNPSNNETFTLTDAAGLAVTFVFKTGVTTVDGTKDGDNVIIGVSGASGHAASVGDRIRAAINASDLAMTATETSGGAMTLTQHGLSASGNTAIDMSGVTTVTATDFTGGIGSDSPDHCLWWNERAIRTDLGFLPATAVDIERETIRKSKVRDVLGQNKMVEVSTGGFVEQGEPTLYDIKTAKHYEGSTYATRRLSRPYKLNLDQSPIIAGGPNFANATPASPNDMMRSSTRMGHNIQITSLQDDAPICQDEYTIQDGPIGEKRRAHIVTLADTVLSTTTPLKGSLITHPRYGAYPNDASPTWRNVHHDSYGQDHEVPMQGVFASEWVGGNQHRHIDLNKFLDGALNAEATRAELYKVTGGNTIKHPHDVNTDHPAARWTRDGTAKRAFNIANINTAVNEDNYTTYTGTPKLGNYTRDYEVVQTSGRSQNNRWHVRNPEYTPDSIVSTYITGLYDFSLPDRTKNSADESFGRTEHVFVERFSAPGEPATLSRGALDIQAEEFSAYNSLNYRNLRVRNHLNFWHKEHTAQFGYREDYIHGTESDAIGGVSNDFGGNTANVGAWHKNNRNPLTRMYLHSPTQVETRRRYDNFYISHQIPQSDWQYHWITSSAVHFNISGQPALQEYDDEERAAYTPTVFPWNNDGDGDSTDKLIFHPRLSGYITDYPNATIGVSGSLDWILTGAGAGQEVSSPGLLTSGSLGITYNSGGTSTTVNVDVDFVYGNYIVVDPVDWTNNLIGASCPSCELNRPLAEYGTGTQKPAAGNATLNALLLNRNGPYQGASWKMLQNGYSPIVRQQRQRNVITIQNTPDSNKLYENKKEAINGAIKIYVNSVPSADFTITADPLIEETDTAAEWTVTVPVAQFSGDGAVQAIANYIAGKINELDEVYNVLGKIDGTSKISASSTEGSNIVVIETVETGALVNLNSIVVTLPAADVATSSGNLTDSSALYFTEAASIKTTANDHSLPIEASSTGLVIADDSGNKKITVYFQGGADEKVRSWRYNDRRSDNHTKYIEPAATWNMPMQHMLSEKTDNIGVTAVHSYSNNLKTFANPKLSYKTGFDIKDTSQNYDVLFDKYSPFNATQPELDFVGLFYKEYIFPKNRNVGLLKTRARASWDDVAAEDISSIPTGQLRIFWKNNVFERIKGPISTTVNAIGYTSAYKPSYLLEEDGTSLDSWNQSRSIFAMDNFVYDREDATGATAEWTCKGDLQYVGWPTYMSWIINRSCEFTPQTDYVNYANLDVSNLEDKLGTNLIQAALGKFDYSLQSHFDGGIGMGFTGSIREYLQIPDMMATGGGGPKAEVHYNRNSNSSQKYAEVIGLTFDGYRSEVVGGTKVGFYGGEPKMGADATLDGGGGYDDIVVSDHTVNIETATRAEISPRCISPEVVVQLYYNPHGEEKREGAWRYKTNEMAGKNPWYDKYIDFSLETRCMAQNYGVVAEFRVSEHMDKYLMIDGGDFRTKNFNFLSLHGASYNTVAPHYATHETAWSGKVTYPSEKVYSPDGTYENVVSEFPHSDEMYSGWQDLSVDSDDPTTGFEYLQNRIKTMNNAFSNSEGRGTFNSPSAYTDYVFQNPIYVGGNMSIENCNATLIPVMGEGGYAQILPSSPWDGRVSWGQGTADDGTGRHSWFAAGEELLTEVEDGATTSYKGGDSDADGIFGYDDPDLTATTSGTGNPDLPPVYREANSFSEWKSITPFSNDKSTADPALACMKFNMNGATDEYMHGQITLWDKYTTTSANDTNIYGVSPFGKMTEKRHYDTLRVPSDAASESGATSQARLELYASDATTNTKGTPITISVWAKPEVTGCSTDQAVYDNVPVGLYVFGSYINAHFNQESQRVDFEVNPKNQKSPGNWRRDIHSAEGAWGVYANFPAPVELRDDYPFGMGLTFFMNQAGDDHRRETMLGVNAIDKHPSFDWDEKNIYHFFRRDTQGDSDDNNDKWVPATLPEGEWNNVVLQILPAIGSKPPKIKMTLTNSKTRPDGDETTNKLYSEVLYGIHRSALTNTTYRKTVYSVVPVGKTAAWGEEYGWGGNDFSADNNNFMYNYDYKIGKAVFADVTDNRILATKRREDEYWYFNGELMEFSMWAGVLSKADINWIRPQPKNLLEGYLNGEVLGGYTKLSVAQEEWGNNAPTGVLTVSNMREGTVKTATGAISYSQTQIGLTTEASCSTCKLAVWHRLGVHPTINIGEMCEDWDDEFFNSYVHTDTIQFYDAIVEDHDGISPTARRRLRFKVNALKKLMPYRGFYPQDRTLQLAELFTQKMKASITGADTTILLEEQAMQAAMQPFFAPGILYNSIKAGIAVDWPAFTNATGLEPVYPNSQCTLPFYNEDIHGLSSEAWHAKMLTDALLGDRGPEVQLSSIVPNWFSPRANPYSPDEGLLAEYEKFTSDADAAEAEEYIVQQQANQLKKLYKAQPKFFACLSEGVEQGEGGACADAANGYIIRAEPDIRIPFEGLVSLDSVLPKSSDNLESLGSTIDEGDFKYVDLEISGWDCEGVEITFKQPEALFAAQNDDSEYPDGNDEWAGNYTIRSHSVTIGDRDREIGGSDWDVNVDFQRPPKGFGMPSFNQDGSSTFAGESDAQWSIPPYSNADPITLDEMNEEIAVKLCYHINHERPDIHFVAIPGQLISYKWSDRTDHDRKWNGDAVARIFPAVYPEIFGISKDDLAPTTTDDTLDPYKDHGASYVNNLWNKPELFKPDTMAPPRVGRQHSGTWRIRLVYVGPPKMRLDLAQVELSHTEVASDSNSFGFAANSITELGMKPWEGVASESSCSEDSFSTDDYSPYDTGNTNHTSMAKAGGGGFINSAMLIENEEDIYSEEGPAGCPQHWIHQSLHSEAVKHIPLNWKVLHLVNPFQNTDDTGNSLSDYEYPYTGGAGQDAPSYWMRAGSVEPWCFFTGGAEKASDMVDGAILGDVCAVSITRHLGTLALCEWIDGWGWKGSAKYSVDTELGIRQVSADGVTMKGNYNDQRRYDTVSGGIQSISGGFAWDGGLQSFQNDASYLFTQDETLGVESTFSERTGSNVAVMEESAKPQQGPFTLYGGYTAEDINQIRVTPKPHQIYLMVPEYYVGAGNESGGGDTGKAYASNWRNYCYPYFEYQGNNGDPRFEMAMHNFLAEVPNFFLKDSKLVSFASKPESQFKVMEAGKTYYMNVSMNQSENFTTLASPYSDSYALGRPNKIAFGETGTSVFTMEGRYYGPAFQWKGLDDYRINDEAGLNSIEAQMLRDPAQAPYVPPYLYGKQTARISFTPSITKKFTLEEIFAGAKVTNISPEAWQRFVKCAQEDNGDIWYNSREISSSPAWKARTTISASMNLFGKTSIKQIEYRAQLANLRDDLDESLQKFVPLTATDSQGSSGDVWTIGTKWECPILNFYTAPALSTMAVPALSDFEAGAFGLPSGRAQLALTPAWSDSDLQIAQSENGYVIKDTTTEGENSGMGIWSSYGVIPAEAQGVFVTIEESTISSATKSHSLAHGSLIDVCGFQPQKQKVGEIAPSKEISEAVVMIPFVDKESDTTAETIVVDGRHFFKINKDLFNMQKNNIEAGDPAVKPMQWFGVTSNQEIQETSISKMIKLMKKYNLPPKFDFVRYPMEASEDPFVMYIFEFNHRFDKQDLADIWQGLPPKIAVTAEHDSSTLIHDLSPVDFFEENNLPRHVRWMTFKVKKRAKEDYFEATARGTDDGRFSFDFEMGKTPPKYSYNWPYDYFTMLELIQVEAGLDIFENQLLQVPQVTSSQDEISSSEVRRQIGAVKESSVQDMSRAPATFTFGTEEDR